MHEEAGTQPEHAMGGEIDLTETELSAMGARWSPGAWRGLVSPTAPTAEDAKQAPKPEPPSPEAGPAEASAAPTAPNEVHAPSTDPSITITSGPVTMPEVPVPLIEEPVVDLVATEGATPFEEATPLVDAVEAAPLALDTPLAVDVPPTVAEFAEAVAHGVAPNALASPASIDLAASDLDSIDWVAHPPAREPAAETLARLPGDLRRDAGPTPSAREAPQPLAEPSVIVDPALSLPLPAENAAPPTGELPTVQSFFGGEVAAVADHESLLPFFVPSPSSAPGPQPPSRPVDVPAPPPPWFERFFDADYLDLEPQPSARLTKREADFIVSSLRLTEGARVLDLACGSGRHAVELASRGLSVVGLDLSPAMLERAAALGRTHKVAVDFVRGDMRTLGFRRWFDAVLCWGTSFGYFRDVDNALVLRRIAHALRPGGRLLLQVVNRDFVLRDVPRTWWHREGDSLVLDEIDFDPRSSRFRFRRSLLRSDGRERVDSVDLRGYALSDLLALLAAEGFTPLEVSGRITTPGAFFGAESPHVILLAELR